MVTVKRVESKADRRRFVDFPNQLYKDNPNFVPATYGDDLSDWDPKANPAFSYCEAQSFLAYRDGEIVGRIGAILSHRANEKWNTSRMRFSQVDFIDDPEVSAALFQAVEDFAREKGCKQVHGPLGFTDLDREGMLVEGYDRRSLFLPTTTRPITTSIWSAWATARIPTGSNSWSRSPRMGLFPSGSTTSPNGPLRPISSMWPRCVPI